ncbi:seipin-like isoform X1 [Seriola lalandi dorsalis]|uniref:Seipin n=1 Tax=Seriola lalandi dorsalis TaxID=1841481 RepID=A0A3B4XQG7_SERLL|nr:seipin-like isoform X1 [Seriola lalandi dorsalis]
MDQESPLRSQHDEELSVLIGRSLLRLQDAVVTAMSHTRKKVLQGFVVFSVILLLLWLAAFLYGSFYYSYMPKAAFSTPVHYYYRTDCESPSSFLCSYPVANISLMRNKKHVLTFGQAYQISLQLELPESPTNQELGMFMVKTTCFSRDGGQIASSARSARQLLSTSSSRFSMLRYRSDLLRTMGTLLFLPAFLSGAIEQKQMLEVELFSDFTDDPYAPSVTAVIEILSNKVQIYSSQLYVHAHFTGIRYLLFYFPVSSALVGVSSNFIFLSVLFILSYMRLLLRVEWKPEQLRTDGSVSERENMNSNEQEDEKDVAAGTAELLGPLQITPTNLSRERPQLHFGNGTELQNRHTLSQVEINETEAA